MAETKQGSALGGCLGLVALLLIGSCVFGGSDKKDAAASATALDARPAPSSSNSSDAPSKRVGTSFATEGDIAKAAETVKEQFFPDRVDHSGSASYQREWWMIKGALRQAGYPCAAVAFVQQQLDGTFKAICKVKLHSNKYDAFTINPDTRSIDPL